MGFVKRGEAVAAAHSLADLKLVYRELHRSLSRSPELMDSDFLLELQEFLHQCAVEERVDTTDHGQWDQWLSSSHPASSPGTSARS
ncbi:hypothetical protein K2X85_07630 [bacterium]|nr:hypothetical protein [bacterium]